MSLRARLLILSCITASKIDKTVAEPARPAYQVGLVAGQGCCWREKLRLILAVSRAFPAIDITRLRFQTAGIAAKFLNSVVQSPLQFAAERVEFFRVLCRQKFLE